MQEKGWVRTGPVPNTSNIWLSICKICLISGEYSNSLNELQIARAMEPSNSEILKLIDQVKKEKSEYDSKAKEQVFKNRLNDIQLTEKSIF